MSMIPKLYTHGEAIADCVGHEGITVMERTDEALWLRFDGAEGVWPLGWAAYFSGRFVSFPPDALEEVHWV